MSSNRSMARPSRAREALQSALKNGDRPALLLVHRGATSVFVTLERSQSR